MISFHIHTKETYKPIVLSMLLHTGLSYGINTQTGSYLAYVWTANGNSQFSVDIANVADQIYSQRNTSANTLTSLNYISVHKHYLPSQQVMFQDAQIPHFTCVPWVIWPSHLTANPIISQVSPPLTHLHQQWGSLTYLSPPCKWPIPLGPTRWSFFCYVIKLPTLGRSLDQGLGIWSCEL